MNNLKVFIVSFACIVALIIAGCGGKNVNGSLTVNASTPDSTTTTSTVTFTVQYTNPQETDLINTEITYQLIVDTVARAPVTVNTNNSGGFEIGWAFPRTANDQVIQLVARTGDLVSSDIVVIPGLGALAVSAGVIDLTTSSSGTITISGGVLPYHTDQPGVTGITAQLSGGDTLQVSKDAGVITHGTTSVIISDSSATAQRLTVSITY